MDNFISELRKAFEAKANPANAQKQKAYMRHQFEFFGLNSKENQELRKEFFLKHGTPPLAQVESLVTEMWQQPEREFQYFAMMMLDKYIKKADETIVELIEFMVINKSWWDTVDMIASWLAGSYFRRFPQNIPFYTEKWMASGNYWLQRICLLFQLKYKTATDKELLFGFIERLSDEDEFFIRKAIGWALREYSKTNPQAVIQFVDKHPLKPLSRKEALKVIARRTTLENPG
jgi:3-methyladenine DNA glycosylase AlkD